MHRKLVLLLIGAISVLLSIWWFCGGTIMGAGESGLAFYNLNTQYAASRYSWEDSGLGNSVGIGVAAAPTYLLLSSIQNIGVSTVFIQAAFFAIVFAIAGISIYFLTFEMVPEINNKYALLSVFFYWFNPISLVNVWNRFLYNFMAFWALLPTALLLFLVGIRKRDYRFSLLTSLSTVVLSFSLTSAPFDITLIFLLIYVFIYYLLLSKSFKEKIFLIVYFLITIASFVLMNLWWIGQLFSFIFSKSYAIVTSDFFSSTGNLSTLNSLSDSLGQLVNVFRYMHGSFFVNGPEWAKVFSFPILDLMGFVVTLLILLTVIKFKKNKEVLLQATIFILSIFLIKGNSAPLGEVFQFFFIKIPVLQVFRNPFEKFGLVLPLAASPLFALSVKSVFDGQAKKVSKKIRIIFYIFLFLLVSIYTFPFLTKYVFTYQDQNGKNMSYATSVPSYYKQMDLWFTSNGNMSRLTVVPIGGEGITYNWPHQYSGVESSAVLFSNPSISFNTSIPFYSDLISELSKYQLNKKLVDFLPFLNSKYIIWRGDIDYKIRQMPAPSVVKKVLDDLVNAGIATKSYDTGKLAAYEINTKLWPKIYSTSDVYVSNTKDFALLSDYVDDFPNIKSAVVTDDKINQKLMVAKSIYVPEKTTIQKVSVPLPNNLTDQELLGKLFYASHLPGEWEYPFIRLNEKLLEIREKDYYGWLLYKVGILGKRTAEIYKLKKSGAENGLIQSSFKGYESDLNSLSPDIDGLIQNGGPVADVVKNSLIYQWEILGRASPSYQTSNLSDLLTSWGVKPVFELPVSKDNYVVYRFLLPEGGNYTLSGLDSSTIFVDGKISTTAATFGINLTKGEHEISKVVPDDVLYKIMINQSDDFVEDNKSSASWGFSIPNMPQTYQVDFDYRYIKGDAFKVKIAQDTDDSQNPSFQKNVGKDQQYSGWSHFNSSFVSNNGSTNANLSFGPAEEKICQKLWWGWNQCDFGDSTFEIEIKNLRVNEIETTPISLIKNNNIQNSNQDTTSVSFFEVSPAIYNVHIVKNNTNPEVLVFSELFNSGWEAAYMNGGSVSESDHLLVNGYANGWVIDKSGEYGMTIKFLPENILKVDKVVSIIFIAMALTLTVMLSVIKKRNEIN